MSKKKLNIKTSPDKATEEDVSLPILKEETVIDLNKLINVHLPKDIKEFVKTTVEFYPEAVSKIVILVNSVPSESLIRTLSALYPIPASE